LAAGVLAEGGDGVPVQGDVRLLPADLGGHREARPDTGNAAASQDLSAAGTGWNISWHGCSQLGLTRASRRAMGLLQSMKGDSMVRIVYALAVLSALAGVSVRGATMPMHTRVIAEITAAGAVSGGPAPSPGPNV
jgi:hypothetical protein